MNQVDFIQFNCNGIRANYNQIALLIKDHKPKFILLQELRLKKIEKCSFEGYHLIRKHPQPDSAQQLSIGILMKFGLESNIK